MTLCIGAIARKENKIITVTDFLLSTESDSAESPAMKVAKAGSKNRWRVMFAGDPSTFIKVNTDAYNRLIGTEETAKDVMTAFEDAFKDRLKRDIEDALSRYGLTREQFLKDGRKSFGKEEFLRILLQIQNTGLDTDFLVAGFDGSDPCLLSIRDPGIAYLHDLSSFHAIGCGALLADASLMGTFNPNASTTDIIYRLSEAKFISERTPTVGGSTFVTVFERDGKWNAISPPEMERIKTLWNKKGRPPVPSEAAKIITKSLREIS